MCSATLGATPVNRCTVAASAIFSCGVRGTPGWANTLNRVPELPKAQDGVSIRCADSACFTRARSTMLDHVSPVGAELVLEVEHLGQQLEGLVRPGAADGELRHLRLPAGVRVGPGHRRPRGVQVVGLDVADD